MSNSIKSTIISTISKEVSFAESNINEGICIDTSNHRIGFDIFDPLYPIDLHTPNATINFKDSIRLKGINSFFVSSIKTINSSTDISCNMLMSRSLNTDFSSIEAAPIIYKSNALYPLTSNINLGTSDFCWNFIYCKKIIGIDVQNNIDCSNITCTNDISCNDTIYSQQYNIYSPASVFDIISNPPKYVSNNVLEISFNSCISHINAKRNNNNNNRASIAFLLGWGIGMCTLFGSDANPSISSDLSSTSIAMIIYGGLPGDNIIKNKRPYYVGIGTINPNEKLEVIGNILVSGNITINTGLNIDINDISCNDICCNNINTNNSDMTANTLHIHHNATIKGSTTIDNVKTLNDNLNVIAGDTSFNSNLVTNDLSGDTRMIIMGNLKLNSDIDISVNSINMNELIINDLSVNTLNCSCVSMNKINVDSITNDILEITSDILNISGIKWAQNYGTAYSPNAKYSFFFTGCGLKDLNQGSGGSGIRAPGDQQFPNIGYSLPQPTDHSTQNYWLYLDSSTKNSQLATYTTWIDWTNAQSNLHSQDFMHKLYFTILVIDENNEVYKYAALSDKKLKTNIQPFNQMLDLVKKLNPVYFKWIDSSYSDYGFIAQELEELMPEIITYNKDNNGEITKIYSINAPIHFISVLTKAIQDLAEDKDTEIEKLKAENTELKDENIIFKSKIETLKNDITTLEEENNIITTQIANILQRLSVIEN